MKGNRIGSDAIMFSLEATKCIEILQHILVDFLRAAVETFTKVAYGNETTSALHEFSYEDFPWDRTVNFFEILVKNVCSIAFVNFMDFG